MQNFDHNIGFKKNANLFAENCRKSRKIVIITSNPGHTGYKISSHTDTQLKPPQAESIPGLPDGLFSNQKSKFGSILEGLAMVRGLSQRPNLPEDLRQRGTFGGPLKKEGLAMEDVGIFYGHLVHFTVFCYILWAFGICSSW
jgi:hypothetical protein